MDTVKAKKSNGGFLVLNLFFGIIAGALVFLSLSGCAATKPNPGGLMPVYGSSEPVNLRFERPINIPTPEKEPNTVEEHIRCGLFYFDRERFTEAAEEFGKAREMISESENNIYRACLISAAVSHLMVDNREAFITAVKELKSTYSNYQLIVIEERDRRVRALFKLYDNFIETGNF